MLGSESIDSKIESLLSKPYNPVLGVETTKTLAQELPIALKITKLPASTSSADFYTIITKRKDGATSARDEALKVLKSSDKTPDSTLKLRLKFLNRVTAMEAAVDPRLGSGRSGINFKLLDK